MTGLPLLFAIAAVLGGTLATVAVWAPRRVPVKLLACAVAAMFLPTGYGALASLLGLPRPAALEWWNRSVAEAIVLASSFDEGHAIYLWLVLPGQTEPRAYALPWNQQLAQQLQAAEQAARETGTGVGIRMPFEPSLDDLEPKAYALPQPALPPKDAPPPAALEFVPPSREV